MLYCRQANRLRRSCRKRPGKTEGFVRDPPHFREMGPGQRYSRFRDDVLVSFPGRRINVISGMTSSSLSPHREQAEAHSLQLVVPSRTALTRDVSATFHLANSFVMNKDAEKIVDI